MSRSELTNLTVTVSILCEFEDGQDWTDWDLGTHGIRSVNIILGNSVAVEYSGYV